jgi:hypothetical protein
LRRAGCSEQGFNLATDGRSNRTFDCSILDDHDIDITLIDLVELEHRLRVRKELRRTIARLPGPSRTTNRKGGGQDLHVSPRVAPHSRDFDRNKIDFLVFS